jgi:hypothetical protein
MLCLWRRRCRTYLTHRCSAVSYGLSFAALSSVLVHVWLWHRDEIKEGDTAMPFLHTHQHLADVFGSSRQPDRTE